MFITSVVDYFIDIFKTESSIMHSSIFATLFIYRNTKCTYITLHTLVIFRHLKIVVYKKGLNAFQIYLKLVPKRVCMHVTCALFIRPSGALIFFRYI